MRRRLAAFLFWKMLTSVRKTDLEWESARAQSIARRVRPLTLGMPVGAAVEALRLSGLSELPVLVGGSVIGVAGLSLFSRAIAGCESPERLKAEPLANLLDDPSVWRNLTTGVYIASVDASLAEIENYFAERPDVQVVPIIEAPAGYFGVVARFDLAAARLKTLAPPRMGGMATPLGVYLTDGVHAGGAGNFGLFLSGVVLGVLSLASNLIVSGAALLCSERLRFDVMRYVALHYGDLGSRFGYELGSLAVLPVMMALLRLMPLAGYHAAEHQVVHCIERGEMLEPGNVRRMPRVHPRCGTNIAAAAALFSGVLCAGVIGWQTIIGAVAPAALLTLSFWRPLGSFLQQNFTTRPASDKQIRSGIKAAEDLLAKYRQDVTTAPTIRSRILGSGLLQIFAGVLAVSAVCLAAAELIPALRPYVPSLF